MYFTLKKNAISKVYDIDFQKRLKSNRSKIPSYTILVINPLYLYTTLVVISHAEMSYSVSRLNEVQIYFVIFVPN